MNVSLTSQAIASMDPAAKDPISEANHRIANSLTLLASMVQLQARDASRRPEPVSPADMRRSLEGIAARIGTIGQLHRILARTSQHGAAALLPHLREVGEVLVAALSSPERAARLVVGGVDCMVPARQVQPIVLILCEIFINAMKYAHPAGMPLVMSVECAIAADGRLTLAISDDGVGLPDGFDAFKSDGLGLRVIRNLAAELNAELDINSSELGLSFRLSLPAGQSGKLS
jgi:two-component sensor histidine kinase